MKYRSQACLLVLLSMSNTIIPGLATQKPPADANNVFTKPHSDPIESQPKPFTTPTEPFTTPAEPFTTPAEPLTTQDEPFSTPADPFTTPAEPFTTPAEPFTTPAEPFTTPAEPLTSQDEPFTTPAEPLTSQDEPFTTPVEPFNTTTEPLTSQDTPITIATEPLTSQDTPIATQGELAHYLSFQQWFNGIEWSSPRCKAAVEVRYGAPELEELKCGSVYMFLQISDAYQCKRDEKCQMLKHFCKNATGVEKEFTSAELDILC